MRKVSASRVIQGAVELTGRLFSRLSNDELPLFIGSFNRNLREVWEKEFWPSIMAIEERYFRDLWAAGTYTADAEVYHSASDKYYKNTSGSSTTGVPGTSADWEEQTDYIGFISFTQTGKTEIGQVYRVTNKDPRLKLNFDTVETSQKDDQVVVCYPRETSYWVEFRKRAPLIKAEKYSSSTTYIAGDQVYYTSTSGQEGADFWEASAGNSGTAPAATSGNPWTKIDIPYIFGPYLEHAIAADILLVDEKIELAGIQMRERDRMLESEIKKVKNQSGDAFRPIFNTY